MRLVNQKIPFYLIPHNSFFISLLFRFIDIVYFVGKDARKDIRSGPLVDNT